MGILNFGGVSCKQWLHGIGFRGLDDIVHPVTRNIDPGQLPLFHDAVDLADDNTVLKGGGFRDHGGFFCVIPCVQVSVAVRLVRGDQADLGGEIHVQSAVKLQICMDVANAELSGFQHLGQAQTLNTGKGKVQFFGNAFFKQIQVVIPRNGGNEHIEAIDLAGVQLGHCVGQERGLLLVAALQYNFVSAVDDPFQKRNDLLRGYFFAMGQFGGFFHPLSLGQAFTIPNH